MFGWKTRRSPPKRERRSARISRASSWTETSFCCATAADNRPTIVLQTEIFLNKNYEGQSARFILRNNSSNFKMHITKNIKAYLSFHKFLFISGVFIHKFPML